MTEGEVEPEWVFRFSPLSPQALLEDAEDQANIDEEDGVPPRWGISAWLGVLLPDESIGDCAARLLQASGTKLSGKWMAVMLREEVVQAGYPVVLDEPPPHHCLIMLKDEAALSDVTALATLANSKRQRNPMGRRS